MNYAELDFNEEFASAFEAMEAGAGHLFITGKAGTGKSTLLQYFREKTSKNAAFLAPTGVAAINIKGQTIHSFFNFKPDITPETVADIPVRKRKRKMFAHLEALVIDEVSMVRADLLDCVDIFLRLYGPDYNRPFGGVRMIFFGDLLQLPPVVSTHEADIFRTHYATPYFFSAKAMAGLDFKILQLTKIYRQKDENFIRLLNAVREDNVDHHHWQALNSRFNPRHQFSPEDFYIVLTTTNALADKVNTQRLQDLEGMPRIYKGAVAGEFERKSLPTPEVLELKIGAQVMMLNNDPDKRWVNGTLGKIVRIHSDEEGDDIIMVELEDGSHIDVKKYTWEIYQYYFDEANNALSSKVMGYFTQYPLKLAWAVTIHKSQGQTFDRVVIDVGWGTFSHGQMYVALSRCRSLDGIVLKQPLNQRHILMDERILSFMKKFVFLFLIPFFAVASFAQTPEVDRANNIQQDLNKLEDKQVNPNTWEEQNSQQPYIGLLTETDTVLHEDWSFDQDYHVRVKIQKDSVKNLGQWPVYYNKSREAIKELKAFVETPEGRRLEATDIKDMAAYDQSPLYSDMRLRVITLPQISVGAVIDVRVKTKVFKEAVPGQFWDVVTYPSIPSKYTRYTYVFPKGKDIHFNAFNSDKQPLAESQNNNTKYSYIFENTSYSADENFMPPSEETIGVLSMSSMADWKQVADWWRTEINKNAVDDPDITAKANELTKGKTSTPDKLRAIVEFIQDNFRFVSMSMGDHTVSLHTTHDIFKARYGDTKDLGLLARQMLKAVGIESNICLMSGEFNGDPRHQLPNPSAFDHLILQVAVDGKKYFIDPQAKGFDLGQLPSSYDNAHVMVVTPDSFEFRDLPAADESFHTLASDMDITVDENGSADFKAHVKLPVEAAQDYRSSWDPNSDPGKQKFFDNLQATFAQGGKVTDHDVKGLEERYGPMEFDFKYSSDNVYQVANNMILLRDQQAGGMPEFNEDTRQFPIFLPNNSLTINRNTYHIPDSLKVDFVPPDYNLSTDYMQVSVKYTRGGEGVITMESATHVKRALVPMHAMADVKKFREDLEKNGQMYIVLKRKSNVTHETENWIKKQ